MARWQDGKSFLDIEFEFKDLIHLFLLCVQRSWSPPTRSTVGHYYGGAVRVMLMMLMMIPIPLGPSRDQMETSQDGILKAKTLGSLPEATSDLSDRSSS